jgi:hypothetical protein
MGLAMGPASAPIRRRQSSQLFGLGCTDSATNVYVIKEDRTSLMRLRSSGVKDTRSLGLSPVIAGLFPFLAKLQVSLGQFSLPTPV